MSGCRVGPPLAAHRAVACPQAQTLGRRDKARNQPIGDPSKPPVDELTDTVGGKYQLVIVAAKRARQITAFRTQLGEGLLEYTGPLVTPRREREQPLSIALREIHQGVLKVDTPDYL